MAAVYVLISQRMQAELIAYMQTIRVRDQKQPLFATQRKRRVYSKHADTRSERHLQKSWL
jgi:uncharacterized protein YqfB (UPF0267 family)